MNFLKKYIHYIIGLAIMFGFRLIPMGTLPNVTEIGLSVLGIFIGTIYLWTTVDPMSSSMIGLFMLAFSGFAPLAQFFAGAFGTPVVNQMFFLMIFMAGLTNRKLTAYIGRWIITRPFIEGKPWLFTACILYGCYVMAVFIGAFAPIFLFWPILYGVFKDVGFKKDDKYVTILLIAVVVCTLIGFPVPPYMSNGLALLSAYRGHVFGAEGGFAAIASIAGTVSDASYFLVMFTFGLLEVLMVILIMKYILRPNVEPLKKVTIDMLNKNPLPPMNQAQRVYGVFLVIFIAVMLLPSLFPNAPILGYLNTNSTLLAGVLVLMLVIIKVDDGPVLRIGPTMGEFGWPTYWLCLTAIYLGNCLTSETTGITAFLNTILGPIFAGMSGYMFTVVICLVCILLTNISNSLVIGMIMQPVILTYCATAQVNPAPIISIMIFTVLSTAACTPAASPFAAMLFGNTEYLKGKDIYKYSGIFVVCEAIAILTLGVAYSNLVIK